MKPPLSRIKQRAEFEQILADTLASVAAREAAEPGYPVWKLLRVQLDAAKQWTRKGRGPSKEERDEFMVGTIVARELEPAYDLKLYELCQDLHELQYYLQVHL